MQHSHPLYIRITAFLLFITLAIYGLIHARDFLYPIALATLFSGLLYPVVTFLEKHRVPRALAILLSILAGIVVLGGLAYLLSTQLRVFVENFEPIRSKATENINAMRRSIEDTFGITIDNLSAQWPSGNLINNVFSATTGTLVRIGLQPVYVFFFLYYRDTFHRFAFEMVPRQRHTALQHILDECALVAKNYVGGLFVVVLILCVLNSTGLYVIGLNYAILFGVLSAVVNFIPYFGTLMGGCIPLAYALLVESPTKGLYVALLFVGIQFLENNILTPRITGGYVNINPIITILGIIIGGMVWGIPGMFLSVPALAVIKSICSYIEELKPVAHLLERNNNG